MIVNYANIRSRDASQLTPHIFRDRVSCILNFAYRSRGVREQIFAFARFGYCDLNAMVCGKMPRKGDNNTMLIDRLRKQQSAIDPHVPFKNRSTC
jgi:hypothetical protein